MVLYHGSEGTLDGGKESFYSGQSFYSFISLHLQSVSSGDNVHLRHLYWIRICYQS